jgi:hypothetical protein
LSAFDKSIVEIFYPRRLPEMENTREKILQAAGEVFAQEGFLSTRIPVITEGDATPWVP